MSSAVRVYMSTLCAECGSIILIGHKGKSIHQRAFLSPLIQLNRDPTGITVVLNYYLKLIKVIVSVLVDC